MTLAAVTAVAVLILDQITKSLALARLHPATPVGVIDGVFSLTLVMNPGLAFGLLSSTPTAWRWIVALLSIGALVVLAVVGFRMLSTGGWLSRLSLGLIFGGAIGNLIDRVRFGAVVDFLDFYWRDYHWPAFNVADSAISVGVTLLAWRLLVAPPLDPAASPKRGRKPGAAGGVTEGGPRQLRSTVGAAEAGMRLDRWLCARLPEVSRTRIKVLIDHGRVRLDDRPAKAARRLRAGERVEVEIPPPPSEELAPEPIPLAIVFEDDDVLVVDKPAGMVTHPGAGHRTGTLAAAALAHAPGMGGVGGARRPGIVHRLDKGTSGLIVLAKTQRAYDALTAQLARRSVTRRYLCLVHGTPGAAEGVIDRPMARDPRSRVRMAVAPAGKGRRAVTRFRVLERFRDIALVECRLETGRTHQIRVHLASIGHPLLGDETYGVRDRRSSDAELKRLTAQLGGVALHATGLAFAHPVTGTHSEFTSPLPYRIEGALSHLRSKFS